MGKMTYEDWYYIVNGRHPPQPKTEEVVNDSDWDERQSSNHCREAVRGNGARQRVVPNRAISKPLTNYCPHCKEYVNQNHEHVSKEKL